MPTNALRLAWHAAATTTGRRRSTMRYGGKKTYEKTKETQ
jgi:hypothetical protein